MLAKRNRITEKQDFLYIAKNGTKRKLSGCVVSVVSRETTEAFSIRVGFIVSKKVGNAVTRNLIKRRLRSIMTEFCQRQSGICSVDVVIRALPCSTCYSYKEMKFVIHNFLDAF